MRSTPGKTHVVLRSKDSGDTFASLDTGAISPLRVFAAAKPTTLYLMGYDQSFYRYNAPDSSWTKLQYRGLDIGVVAIDALHPGTIVDTVTITEPGVFVAYQWRSIPLPVRTKTLRPAHHFATH